MSRQILLTISILVSNRPDTVRRCLDSIQPLLRQVPSELVLVDTGCGSRVRAVLGEYTDRIVDFAWRRDFAKARNAGLEQAKGEWFLYLDDDEWFEDVSDIVRFFLSGEYRRYGVGVYSQRNYGAMDGSEYSDLPVARMIRLEPDIRFLYRIHECFNRAPGAAKKLNAYVHHYGYVYRTRQEARDHAMRNISLLLEEREETPRNMKHVLQLVQEYNSIQERDKSLELSREAISMAERGPVESEYCLASLYANEINCYIELNRYEEAVQRGSLHLRSNRTDKLVKGLMAGRMATAFLAQGDYGKCLEHARRYWDTYQDYLQNPDAFLEYETPVTNTAFHEWRLARILGDGIRAAVQGGQARLAWEWFRAVNWSLDFRLLNLDAVADVLKRMPDADGEERECYAGMCGILLERRVLDAVPFSVWEEGVARYFGGHTWKDTAGWAGQLACVLAPDSPRLLAWRAACGISRASGETAALERGEGGSMEGVLEGLAEYALCRKMLCEQIYQPEIIASMPDILPEEYRGAYAISDLLEKAQEGKYPEALGAVREIAELLPGLGGIMKQCLKWLEEQMERRKRESEQATGELRFLARQVKGKIHGLIEAGQYQAALAVAGQLHALLPGDEEISRLMTEISLRCGQDA